MKEKFVEFCKAHPNAIIGCTVGVLAALFMMLVGFWGTLLVLLLGGIGLWLGASKDRGRDVPETIYRFITRVKDLFSVFIRR